MINMSNITIDDFKNSFNSVFLSFVNDGYIITQSDYQLDAMIRDDYFFNSKNRGEKGMSFYKIIFKEKHVTVAEMSFAVIYDSLDKTIDTYGMRLKIKNERDNILQSNKKFLDNFNSKEYSTPYIDVTTNSLEHLITDIIAFILYSTLYTDYCLLHYDNSDSRILEGINNVVYTGNITPRLKGFVNFLIDNA